MRVICEHDTRQAYVIEHNAKARVSQHEMELVSPEADRALETQREDKMNEATNGSTRLDEQVPHHNNEPHPEVLREELQASGYRHTQKRVQEHVQQDRREAEQSQGSLKELHRLSISACFDRR